MGVVIVAIASCARHLATMARLNVGYDLLTYEGDILRTAVLGTQATRDPQRRAVPCSLQTEGRLAGCWVMRIEEGGAVEASNSNSNSNPTRARRGGGPVSRTGRPGADSGRRNPGAIRKPGKR